MARRAKNGVPSAVRDWLENTPDALVGGKETARLLNVAVQNLSGPNGVRGLPDPVKELAATRVWLGPDIKALAAEREATRQQQTNTTKNEGGS